MFKTSLLQVAIGLACLFWGCKQPNIVKHNGEKDRISFKKVRGINYTEISRRKADGLSFNEYGYQLAPEWRINFISNDSVSIYSPTKHQFINFPLTRGYDSIFNTARTWLKVKSMDKDSLKFEILETYGDTIDTRGAKVYMTFYADYFIKNNLRSDTGILKRASRKDSLYIKSLAEKSNRDYHKSFAARQPVILTSKSPLVKLKKWKVESDFFNNFDTSESYMNPTFDIVIDKAYTNFYYSFSVFVDTNGELHYNKPLIPFSDEIFRERYVYFSTAIMKSYLKYYIKAKAGQTLGIPHASEINLHVLGKSNI